MDNFDDAKFFRIFQSNKKYTSALNLAHQISMYCSTYLKFHMNLLQTHGNTLYGAVVGPQLANFFHRSVSKGTIP